MKRKTFGIAAAVLAGALCFGLCACGEGGNSGNVDAENIVGHEVTEAQWEAAFDELAKEDAAYTVKGKIVSVVTETEGEFSATVTNEYSGTYVRNGGKDHVKGTQKCLDFSGDIAEVYGEETAGLITGHKGEVVNSLEAYTEKKADGYYVYFWYPYMVQNWIKGGPIEDFYDASIYGGFEIMDLIEECREYFHLFRFDAEKKGYVVASADGDMDEKYENTVIKFNEEGKIAAIFGEEGEHGFHDRKIVFHFVVEYTAEEIVLPTDYIDANDVDWG